jgi:hypothetical protein
MTNNIMLFNRMSEISYKEWLTNKKSLSKWIIRVEPKVILTSK